MLASSPFTNGGDTGIFAAGAGVGAGVGNGAGTNGGTSCGAGVAGTMVGSGMFTAGNEIEGVVAFLFDDYLA